MAYGRLDVYWPDGRLESYLLESETVSVGRAEGNTVPLDTDALSRYHFSIVNDGERVWVTDLNSANGTFIDGLRLPANSPQELGSAEEIVAGSIRMIYWHLDDGAALVLNPSEENTQPVVREEANLQIRLDVQQVEVWPASSSSAELTVTNTGTTTERFIVRVSGMPGEWLRVTRPELELDPQESAAVLINFKPARRPSTAPGTYPLSVEVAPLKQPELVVRTMLDVSVRAYAGFGLALGAQPDIGDPVPLFLHNQGSAPLMISLSARDARQQLRFRLPAEALRLQPGQRLRVDLGVEALSPRLTGKPASFPFVVQVRSHDESGFIAATQGTVRIAPRVPTRAIVTAGIVLLSLVLVAALALFGLMRPAEPVIESVSVSSSRIMQGEPLTLQISARNLQTVDVLVDNLLTDSGLPGDQRSVPIDTAGLSGTVMIDVIGRSGDRAVSAVISVEVLVPATVVRFEAQPPTLVRNTVSTLALNWEVMGAQAVRISGLSDFTNQLFQSSAEYPPVHELSGIGGIPIVPLELVLIAVDEQGMEFTRTLMVAVIDPQCTALTDVALREGPDPRYQQIGQVPSGAAVIVSAQDGSAGWLRVDLSGGLRGWGEAGDFACADTFSLSDLRTELNVPPLPTATLSPTITPTNLPEVTATSAP
jgi:hypothetical protein